MTPKHPRLYDVQADLDYCGKLLRQARDHLGLTLEDLAAQVHTSKTHIADFETGERDMTLGRFLRLVRALGVSYTEALPPEEPSVLAKIVLLVHARGPAFADALLAFLEVTPDCLRRHPN